MIDALKKALTTRLSYKRALTGIDGERVLDDLVRKYVIADPIVRGDRDATMINVGMQRLTMQILQKVYSNEQQLRSAIEQAHQTRNEEST